MKMNFIFGAVAIFLSGSAYSAQVDFQIAAGTGEGAWNTSETAIKGKVGDTIHFVNDDSVVHRLHTFGAPCEHGPNVQPGTTWDCVTSEPYSSANDGPLYDHNAGPNAQVWIEITQ